MTSGKQDEEAFPHHTTRGGPLVSKFGEEMFDKGI